MKKTTIRILKYATFFIVLLICFPFQLSAQSRGVFLKGFVRNAETSQPLTGANILLKKLNPPKKILGAAAGTNGYYVVRNLHKGAYAIRISYIGYQSLHDTLHISGRVNEYTYTAELNPAKEQLEEVVVTGDKGGATTLEAGRQTVTPENLSHISTPSVSGDLANYLQTLPSVVSVGDRGGKLFIRGGSPDQNIVLMDNIQVYRPFHILGFYSAFPQDLISDAKVYAGGYPAKYRGRLSSVIDVSMRGGNKQRFEGAATVGPFLTGIRAEGPINNRGFSFLASGRFSQIERTAPIFLDRKEPLKFGDQFVKLQNASEKSRCAFTGLHTYDRGKIDLKRDDVFQWSNYGFGGRCVTLTAGSLSLLDVSLNTSYSKNSVGTGGNPEREASIWNINTSMELSYPLKGNNEISGGFKSRVDKTVYTLNEKFENIRSGDDFLVRFSAYLSMDLHIGPNIDVSPGITGGGSFDYGLSLDPRIRAAWRPFGNQNHELNAALGIYHQTIVGLSDERDLGSTFSVWLPTPLEKLPRSWHAILGWRQQIGNLGLTLEGYHKHMSNLAVPIWSNFARFTTAMTAASGTVWGFDVRGEFQSGPIYAYIGYGYSWTQYETHQQNLNSDTQTYHPPHDQRHSVNAVISANLGFASMNIRWQLGSGMPYTRPFGFDSLLPLRDLQDPRDGYGTPRLLYDKPYQGRLPWYHRLDVSMKREFDLGVGRLTAKAGVINAYDRKNLFYFDLFSLRRVNQLSIVPFAAIEISTK